MPRTPAVARVDANPASREAVADVLAFLTDNPTVALVGQNGSKRPLPLEMAIVLRRVGEILEQGHDVDVLDASSDVLTPNEAADLIGISRPTLLKLIDEGVLSATNIPGSSHRRLDRKEVEEFRDGRRAMQEALNSAAAEARSTGLFTRTSKR